MVNLSRIDKNGMLRYLFVVDYQKNFVDAVGDDAFDQSLHAKAMDVPEGFQMNGINR